MTAILSDPLRAMLASAPPGPILVAFSGGLDSTVLLHALAHLPEARRRGVRAVHVDHGLHPQSAAWSAHCRAAAQALGIACASVAADVRAEPGGLERAARRARYAVFARELRPGELLALAHHADDQAETVLLKLLRGAGPEGLGGMRALRPFGSGFLWRPLLGETRATLHEYARARALDWVDDPSNDDTGLRRNFLRRRVLPLVAERWPDAAAAIAHSARWSRAAAGFIAAQAQSAFAGLQGPDRSTLAWRPWLGLDAALRDPVLRLWLRALGLDEPAHVHVAELERQLRGASERALSVRWGDCEVRRYRDLLYAMRPAQRVDRAWQSEWEGALLALPGGGTLALEPREGQRHCPGALRGLRVGYRRGGERLRPAGAPHSRELRLLLQESGVPPWRRDRLPLIRRDGELVAVADLFVSDAGRAWLDAAGLRIAWTPEP